LRLTGRQVVLEFGKAHVLAAGHSLQRLAWASSASSTSAASFAVRLAIGISTVHRRQSRIVGCSQGAGQARGRADCGAELRAAPQALFSSCQEGGATPRGRNLQPDAMTDKARAGGLGVDACSRSPRWRQGEPQPAGFFAEILVSGLGISACVVGGHDFEFGPAAATETGDMTEMGAGGRLGVTALTRSPHPMTKTISSHPDPKIAENRPDREAAGSWGQVLGWSSAA